MSGALLDANALIALCWPQHEHHARIHRWFAAHAAQGWATCAFTQAAFLRIVSQPSFAGRAVPMADVAASLMHSIAHPQHRYLAATPDLAAVLATCTGGVLGHRQVTDAWLLTAAVQHQMKLLTFDKAVYTLLATDAERQRCVWMPD
ncbi:TA system VapC family ribonuclease toxin [Ottowia testudinis]|uniref:Ribonuclease VapC n=1 Tax=Ottowia testudinis TaxID=2816950 RepID=A0A975CJV3_9BURK|nr:TA system VapC family ribonuclease toxin [Ottowia testudinis]QTD47097.1 PIN domain-containing protein [Ottowia testudinis]